MKKHWFLSAAVILVLSARTYAGGSCDSTADCNDNNVCTSDVCVQPVPFFPGTCVHNPLSGGTCPDDGNFCTNDVCSSGVCIHPGRTGVTCADDNNPCTNDLCNAAGQCTHPALNGNVCTSDGNECTNDLCSSGTCVHNPVSSGTGCDDSNDCTSSDVCNTGGQCTGTPIPDCGGGCPFGVALAPTAGGERVLDSFRAYRDQILASSLEGRGFAALYYTHAEEVSTLLDESPRLRLQLAAMLVRFAPAVEDVVSGEVVTLSMEEVATIDALIVTVQRQASAELAADLDVLRDAISKGSIWTTLGVDAETRSKSQR